MGRSGQDPVERVAMNKPLRLRLIWPLVCTALYGACGHMKFSERPRPTTRFESHGTPASEYRAEPTRDDALRGPHAFPRRRGHRSGDQRADL